MSKARLTTKLLQSAAKMAEKKCQLQEKLTQAFLERYGVTYSDIDCDELIDTLDYSGGKISLGMCDAIMEAMGYPPIPKKGNHQ